ncbi:protease Do-like 5, chloroplastic [Dorcoceras hygrometricum]|uniref:Protease Do-like 5, chloroplastic n=1 Tax=Dorcoceras hygrometricum TaxID=472368 RepID=A0A2Z7BSM3_9LAMI|nr:protease Do-like 5, chloroplastic [Dorcoceras hygrometricum]
MSSHTSPASSKRLKAISNEASQQEESNATTLTSIGAVYHRQSKKIRSCNRSHPKPKQNSTNSNDVAENYCRYWTRYPLLTAEQLTNIGSQRNQLKLTQLTAEYSSLIQNAAVPTNPNDDVLAPATKHASALTTAQRKRLNTTTQRQLLNANIQR